MYVLIIPKFIDFFILITYLDDIGWYCVDRKGYLQIDKMKASFKNGRKKEQQVLLPWIEFPGFKKITLESEITSESLKREAVEQQLLYISHERKWQSQIRALTGAPRS